MGSRAAAAVPLLLLAAAAPSLALPNGLGAVPGIGWNSD
jgi:hypothetical protein